MLVFGSDYKKQPSNFSILTDFCKKNKGLVIGGGIGIGFSLFLTYYLFFRNSDKAETKNKEKKNIKNVPKVNEEFKNQVPDNKTNNVSETQNNSASELTNNNNSKTNKRKYYQEEIFTFSMDNVQGSVPYGIFSDPSCKIVFLYGRPTQLKKGAELLNLPDKNCKDFTFVPFAVVFNRNGLTEAEFHCAYKIEESVIYICQRSHEWSFGWLQEQLLLEIMEHHLRQTYKDIKIINKIGTMETNDWWKKNGYANNEKKININDVLSYEFSIKNPLGIKKLPKWYTIDEMSLKSQLQNKDNFFFTEEELECFPILKDCGITPQSEIIPFLIQKDNSICTSVIDPEHYVTIITACDAEKSEYFMDVIKNEMLKNHPDIVAIIAEDKKYLGKDDYELKEGDYYSFPVKYIKHIEEVIENDTANKGEKKTLSPSDNSLSLQERIQYIQKYIHFPYYIYSIVELCCGKNYPDMIPEILKMKIENQSIPDLIEKKENFSYKNTLERLYACYQNYIIPVFDFSNRFLVDVDYTARFFNEIAKFDNSPLLFQLTPDDFTKICTYQVENEDFKKECTDYFKGNKGNHVLGSNKLLPNAFMENNLSYFSPESKNNLKKILFNVAQNNATTFGILMQEARPYNYESMFTSALLTEKEQKELNRSVIFNEKNKI